ncbi:hypothetical protein P152DRAFT_473426 [Eremomyces bilateralis CBS 781.70]|uniref:Ubiquitin-protein ligase E3A N-terminal zinc-binding domain-containing protein n=1 Tax=Eremomyces bilateralis CBS 781.70 TaxID=1392243 RepID=A0A6G1G4A5_9PEZI|nr:uncharacterized protein P152DRAFT_473426 [Eremomyces bilateralis CBS 781.70]KAF1812893.1 hypothetical protein P152DRAFT_473426 [Eremomyces bilateralis CBS 781.70]
MSNPSTPFPAPSWSRQFTISHSPTSLPGDKLLLPSSALEELLAASPVTTGPQRGPSTNAFSRWDSPDRWDAFERSVQSGEAGGYGTIGEERQRQLPHPLTFRVVNPRNGRVVYAGVREFSAEEGTVVVSGFLREALGLRGVVKNKEARIEALRGRDENVEMQDSEEEEEEEEAVTVHATSVPKGTYVKLRPLEPGYDPEDWRALLQEHLRSNYTTLTKSSILVVPSGRLVAATNADSNQRRKVREQFRFLIDELKPESDAICIVDTDLEVDIEALDEEQARETLRRIVEKREKKGEKGGSSAGGTLDLFRKVEGWVKEDEYVDYEIPSWDRSQGLEIELVANLGVEDAEVDLLISPSGARQRARPRDDEFVWADLTSRYPKRIRLNPTNVELETAESIYVSVYAYPTSSSSYGLRSFTIRVLPFDSKSQQPPGTSIIAEKTPAQPGEEICPNCQNSIPSRTLHLHTSFCLRNNWRCPDCNRVFLKNSEEASSHWHCDVSSCPVVDASTSPPASANGDNIVSKQKHDAYYHEATRCPACNERCTSVFELARHRTSTCPYKEILCQFCHLLVPQGRTIPSSDTTYTTTTEPSQPYDLPATISHDLSHPIPATTSHDLSHPISPTTSHDPSLPSAPAAEVALTNLTPHELSEGSRTSDCDICHRPVRLRDLSTHLQLHALDNAAKPPPTVCRNVNCGRTVPRGANGMGAEVGLCDTCFGPLYVSQYDPERKALSRRVERRYLTQLLAGCGKGFCTNEFCKTGRGNLGIPAIGGAKDAVAAVGEFVKGVKKDGEGGPLHFCVDEASQGRKKVAEEKGREVSVGGWRMEWWVKALETERGDVKGAASWLERFAPRG